MDGGDTHSFLVCGTQFDLPIHYTPVKPLGTGAYGVVCAAMDSNTQQEVAIKKILRAFSNITDAKRTLREIKLLRHFRHENVIGISDILVPLSYRHFDDVYLVSDVMDTDLYQIICSPQPLSEEHSQYFLYQLLRGLKYIHSAGVLHRDLKPSNLLVNGNCDLKICDFGLARAEMPIGSNIESATGTGTSAEGAFMTEYVATRWYRAPEVMLCWREYTRAIDMWAVGCIFAELIGRTPLFPGKDFLSQLALITDALGTPTEHQLKEICSEKAKTYVRMLPHKPRQPTLTLLPQASPLVISLLDQMLTLTPEDRITVEQALEHPYFAQLHDPLDEPNCHAQFNFEFEHLALNVAQIKRLVFDEMLAFHSHNSAQTQHILAHPDVPSLSLPSAHDLRTTPLLMDSGGMVVENVVTPDEPNDHRM